MKVQMGNNLGFLIFFFFKLQLLLVLQLKLQQTIKLQTAFSNYSSVHTFQHSSRASDSRSSVFFKTQHDYVPLKPFFTIPQVIQRENALLFHEGLEQMQSTANTKVVGFGGEVDQTVWSQQFVEGLMQSRVVGSVVDSL